MLILRPTGLRERRDEVRDRFAATRPFRAESTVQRTVLQGVAWVIDQMAKPDCVGAAIAGRWNALVGEPWLSFVKLWRLARWNDGTLGDPTVGTWAESAIDALMDVGPMAYTAGEEADPVSLDKQRPSLADEIGADALRIPEDWEHRAIMGTRSGQVDDALERGLLVVFGTGCKTPFFGLGRDEVVTTKHLGGNRDGHEQGIFGYHAGRGLYIGQSSWGAGFGGITLPSDIDDDEIRAKFPCAQGRVLPGCFWMEPDVLERAWDVDVLRVN